MSEQLTRLREKCLSCRACPLGGFEVERGCCANVFSNMNVVARVMVVGQNPGRDEVKQGEPFVGESGKFFDSAVKEVISVERSAFYIANVLRCYTPANRRPTTQELEACRPILDEEVGIIKPRLIIALGSLAFERLTGMSGITKHHGETMVSPRYLIPVIGLLHPSPLNMIDEDNRKLFHAGLRKVGDFLSSMGK